MDNPVIYQALGGLLVLFFLFLTYMFTKTWRWFHVVMVFLVFGNSLFFIGYAAKAVSLRSEWMVEAKKLTAQLEELQAEQERLLYGTTKWEQEASSIRTINAQLGRVILDRGRTWRNCQKQGAAAGSITVSTVPAGTQPESAEPNRITQGAVLYAFLEYQPAQPEDFGLKPGMSVAGPYLGEFTATAVTDTTVTLKPNMPLSARQQEFLNRPGTWLIHETMPVDGHQFFSTEPYGQPNWNSDANEEPIFGEMDQNAIRRLFEPYRPPATDTAATQRFDQMLSEYLRDGTQAVENERPENLWWKVRFEKDFEEQVDVVGEALDGVTGSETFFDRGRANVPLLQRGEAAKFKKDDVGVFPLANATQMERDGIVELVEPVFVRYLNDYAFIFRATSQRLTRVGENVRRLQRNSTEVEATNARVLTEIAFREQERDKLTSDLNSFKDELAKITSYDDSLKAVYGARRKELSNLYRSNYQLEQELRRIEAKLTAEIDARTEAAADSGGG